MKIYHYTKGISMNSIFTDGFIATERKRGLNQINKLTDCAWLTEKTQFPKTALPFISHMPETNINIHINNAVYVDLNKLSEFTKGIYRFVFESDEDRFEKWRFSNSRNKVESNINWRQMESIANKVGDDHRSFWISDNDIALSNFSLEEFKNNNWNSVLTHCSFGKLSKNEISIIEQIKLKSKSACKEYGLPFHHIKKSA